MLVKARPDAACMACQGVHDVNAAHLGGQASGIVLEGPHLGLNAGVYTSHGRCAVAYIPPRASHAL